MPSELGCMADQILLAEPLGADHDIIAHLRPADAAFGTDDP
jgi:hypothetical protein